tara:strand:+ start:195 stop:533 length:339 start_codon:yes stop_codon:yes gene_type:complete
MVLLVVGLLTGCSKAIDENDVAGSYERKEGVTTHTLIFRGNGAVDEYENGMLSVQAKWTIKGGEIELFFILNGNKNYYAFGSDFSLTLIAVEILGERKKTWEGEEIVFTKIK